MKTLEEIVLKWNGKFKMNVYGMTRINESLVYVALNVDARGNLMWNFGADPKWTKRILDERTSYADSCVYHIDTLLKKAPQLIQDNILQFKDIHPLETERINSHAQVKGYGIYEAVSIDISSDHVAYVSYKHNVGHNVMYNGRMLPSEVIIIGDPDAIPQSTWDEATKIYV